MLQLAKEKLLAVLQLAEHSVEASLLVPSTFLLPLLLTPRLLFAENVVCLERMIFGHLVGLIAPPPAIIFI